MIDTIYLNQYLNTASGNRVRLREVGGFVRFKCIQCQDNWNVRYELFTANGHSAVPTELMDWVRTHRHICARSYAEFGRCSSCGWPLREHKRPIKKPISVNEVLNVLFSLGRVSLRLSLRLWRELKRLCGRAQ